MEAVSAMLGGASIEHYVLLNVVQLQAIADLAQSLQLCLGDQSCEPCPGNPDQPPTSRPSPHGDRTAQPNSRSPLRVLWVSR